MSEKQNNIFPPFAPSPKPLVNLILSLGAAGISIHTLEVGKPKPNMMTHRFQGIVILRAAGLSAHFL